jgi:hypothetical protein
VTADTVRFSQAQKLQWASRIDIFREPANIAVNREFCGSAISSAQRAAKRHIFEALQLKKK